MYYSSMKNDFFSENNGLNEPKHLSVWFFYNNFKFDMAEMFW